MRLNEHPSIYESGNQLNTQISEHKIELTNKLLSRVEMRLQYTTRELASKQANKWAGK